MFCFFNVFFFRSSTDHGDQSHSNSLPVPYTLYSGHAASPASISFVASLSSSRHPFFTTKSVPTSSPMSKPMRSLYLHKSHDGQWWTSITVQHVSIIHIPHSSTLNATAHYIFLLFFFQKRLFSWKWYFWCSCGIIKYYITLIRTTCFTHPPPPISVYCIFTVDTVFIH